MIFFIAISLTLCCLLILSLDTHVKTLITMSQTVQSSSSTFRPASALLPPNKPIKSAMRRTSGRTAMNGVSGDSSAVPREVGFSLPGGDDSCYNGYVSPQWGWYATGSTTPPTPEPFYALPPKTISSSNRTETTNANQHDHEAIRYKIQKIELTERSKASQNNATRMKPVLKKGIPRDASGWPSVPL